MDKMTPEYKVTRDKIRVVINESGLVKEMRRDPAILASARMVLSIVDNTENQN